MHRTYLVSSRTSAVDDSASVVVHTHSVLLVESLARHTARVCTVYGNASRPRHVHQHRPHHQPDDILVNKCNNHDNTATGPIARAPQRAIPCL